MRDTLIDNENRTVVTDLLPGGPAEKAGILKNDLLLFLDGQAIRSTSEFIKNIRSIHEAALVTLIIFRQGMQLTRQVNVEQVKGMEVSVKVARKSFWTGQYADSFNLFLNSEPLGMQPISTENNFVLPEDPANQNIVFVQYKNVRGLWSVDSTLQESVIVRFATRPGYITVINFTYPELEPTVTYKPSDDEVTRLYKAKLNDGERKDYNRIVSDSSLAPRWFKASTLPSLEGKVDNSVREVFWWTSMAQCTIILRVLALWLFLLPIFIGVNINRNYDTFDPVIIYCNPLWLLVIFPLNWLLSWLINIGIFAFNTKGYYLPFEFNFFVIISGIILWGAVNSIKPLHTILVSGTTGFKKFLGFVGLVLEIAGIVFTIIEILKRAGVNIE